MASKKTVVVVDSKDQQSLGKIMEKVKNGNATMEEVVYARAVAADIMEDAKNITSVLDGYISIGGAEKSHKELVDAGKIKDDETETYVVIIRKALRTEDGKLIPGAGDVKSMKGTTITEKTTTTYKALQDLPIEKVDPSLTITETRTTTSLISKKELLERRSSGLLPDGYDKYFVETTLSAFGSDEATAKKTAIEMGVVKR